MAKFISLINWTDQGAKSASDTVDRAEAAQKLAADMGGSMEIYWTMGQYDIVSITDFADDDTAVKFLAKVSSLGNIRTSTMRAFDANDVRRIMS
ncbi:MAG: GYD domain-containing protein [Actinomycetota bacterium]